MLGADELMSDAGRYSDSVSGVDEVSCSQTMSVAVYLTLGEILFFFG